MRKEAEAEARKILKGRTKFGTKEFDSKQNISKERKSTLHSLLSSEDINHCLNNNLDIAYLYTEMSSKYGGDVEKEPKKYYTPTGKPRGRRKKDNNEQEQ